MAFATTPLTPSLRPRLAHLSQCKRGTTYRIATRAAPRMCAAATPQGPAVREPEEGVTDVNLSGQDLELIRGGYRGDMDRMEAAIEAGASASSADVNKRSALHFAAAHGLRTVARLLLDNGADINAQDYGGYTPLHLATCYKRIDTVKSLLEAGADANKATYEGAGEGRLAVEMAEELLDAIPNRKILGFQIGKDEREKRQELVDILDAATECEVDDDEEVDEESARLERAAKALEGGDGTTVVVRKKSVPVPDVKVDDAQVKVTVKTAKDESSVKPVVPTEPAPEANSTPVEQPVLKKDDAEVKVSLKEVKKDDGKVEEVKQVDDSEVKVTIRVRGQTQ